MAKLRSSDLPDTDGAAAAAANKEPKVKKNKEKKEGKKRKAAAEEVAANGVEPEAAPAAEAKDAKPAKKAKRAAEEEVVVQVAAGSELSLDNFELSDSIKSLLRAQNKDSLFAIQAHTLPAGLTGKGE
jgi:ATP-dependent RNA helicase DDX21